VPQEYGGAGMDYICLGLASEELEYVDTSLRVIMSVHAGLNCLSLLTWGTEDQKQRYLVPQAQGRKIAGYGLTEPGAGSDVRAILSTAVRTGSRYLLSGEKSWISLADVADNFLVIAWTDPQKKKERDPSGLTAFIVERTFKGFSSGPMRGKWGILAGNTGWFKMDEVEVPEENILGRTGEGFKIAMFALDQGPPAVAPIRLAQEQRPPEYPGNGPRQMVCDRRLRARRGRRRADSRRQRLLRRISCRQVLSQLQGRGHL
jgi:glutaryl-CoA dehydrogenase (non-decarboxylating)